MENGGDLERYVIRIRRRDPKDPRKISGEVEWTREGRKVAFLSLDSLGRILASAGRETGHKGRIPRVARRERDIRSFAEIMELIREEQEGEEE